MKLIKPYFIIENPDINSQWSTLLQRIESAGRTCYKSEDKITADSANQFIKMIISRGHESVLEHEKITVRFICDRGVSHELVRHRLASFSQESTRYCNYSTDKHDKQLTFIIPSWLNIEEGIYNEFSVHDIKDWETYLWMTHMRDSEQSYLQLIDKDWKPQEARSVLPNSLKTEIVVTANLREWRLIMTQRTAKTAHPQMRELMIPLIELFNIKIPVVFGDIYDKLQNN